MAKTNEDFYKVKNLKDFYNGFVESDGEVIIRNLIMRELPHYYFDKETDTTIIYFVIDSNQDLVTFKHYADLCDESAKFDFINNLLIKYYKCNKLYFDKILFEDYVEDFCERLEIKLVTEKEMKNVNWHYDKSKAISFNVNFNDIPFLKFAADMSGYIDISKTDMYKLYNKNKGDINTEYPDVAQISNKPLSNKPFIRMIKCKKS